MSVGFRPTREDTEIIRAHQRPDESTSDVLRRALRALDRDRWDQQAREDMERIAASGENLADEPDEWGYDEDGSAVDLRGADTGLDIGSGHVEFVGGMPAAADTRTRWDDIVPDMFRRHSAGPDRAALPPEGVRSREHFMAGLAGADLPSAVRLLCTGEAEGSAETALRGIEALLSMAVTAQDEGHPASGRLAHLRTISRRRAGRR